MPVCATLTIAKLAKLAKNQWQDSLGREITASAVQSNCVVLRGDRRNAIHTRY
jgi:hypothetical protein